MTQPDVFQKQQMKYNDVTAGHIPGGMTQPDVRRKQQINCNDVIAGFNDDDDDDQSISCCGCIHIRTGCLIVALLELAALLSAVVDLVFSHGPVPGLYDHHFIPTVLFLTVGMIIGMLIVGVLINNCNFVVPFITLVLIYIVIMCSLVLSTMLSVSVEPGESCPLFQFLKKIAAYGFSVNAAPAAGSGRSEDSSVAVIACILWVIAVNLRIYVLFIVSEGYIYMQDMHYHDKKLVEYVNER